MKLIKQSCEIVEQEIPTNLQEYIPIMYKHIERCGRTCYKSLDKITEDSAEKFVKGLIKSGHLSVLEHGTIYLALPTMNDRDYDRIKNYAYNPYSAANGRYITTNYRVIVENHWENDLEYLCLPTIHHELRHTVLLHTCIHTYKDLTRHRKMSFSIESTRYCNYSKTDKFGEMKFVILPWLPMEEGIYNEGSQMLPIAEKYIDNPAASRLLLRLVGTEKDYAELVSLGWKAQQAAEILPQCTAADVVMSGFDSDWNFVFKLRSDIAATGQPHPLVEELMTPLREDFEKRNWIK